MRNETTTYLRALIGISVDQLVSSPLDLDH